MMKTEYTEKGGTQKLGMPTVTDSVIPQAIVQVPTPISETRFSDRRYGYRPHGMYIKI